MVTWLRGLLAVGLLVSVYVLALLSSVGPLVLATVLMLASVPGTPPPDGALPGSPQQNVAQQVASHVAVYLYIGGILAVIFILIPVLRASRRTGKLRDSVPLTSSDAPELWAMVTEFATTVGTRSPAELRVIPVANAEVSEECRFLGLVGGTRRLYVGLPLLLGMTVDELRAVICHELGHYASRHTRFGAVTYRGAIALQEVLTTFQSAATGKQPFRGFAGWFALPLLLYTWVYARVTATLLRRQETEADAAAVVAVGPASAAASLRSVYALALAWKKFLGQYATVVLRAGFTPGGLYEAFSAMLSDTLFQDVLNSWRESPPDTAPGPFDSHPSIAARVRRIGAASGGARDSDLRTAVTLLVKPGDVSSSVQELALPQGAQHRHVLAWPEWGDLVAEVREVDAAEELLGAARRVAATPSPTLATVLDLLDDGAAGSLSAALTRAAPEADKQDPERRLRDGLAGLVGCMLVQAGYASWQLSWTQPGTLTGIDIAVIELPSLVDAAVRSPQGARKLRGQIQYLGVPADMQLLPTQVTAPPR